MMQKNENRNHPSPGTWIFFFGDNPDEILFHGDADGLRSLAKLLMKLADMNQEDDASLPVGTREYFHLRPEFDLSKVRR